MALKVDINIFRDRILVLDGAMGTMLQRYSLSEKDFRPSGNERPELAALSSSEKELKGNNECLNLTHPEIIAEIHREYIAAGADIIETNTFSANRISQKDYDTESLSRTMALEGARIARKVADSHFAETGRKVYVAGSVGPTSKSLTLASDVERPAYRQYSFGDMVSAYREQINGLMEGGADLILIETCFDALNAKAALYALEQECDGFPAIVSVSANDKSGRTLTGQTLEAFYTSVSHYPLLAFGLNCSLGAADLMPLLSDVSGFCKFPMNCYPNAGLPNEMGAYDETPEEMACAVREMAEKGLLNIVGGCCGTTPEHISQLVRAVSGIRPRPLPEGKGKCLTVSGLEPVTVDVEYGNFTNIGERTNVAGSRKFAKLIAAGDYETGLQIAAAQIENGARIIDINMDDAMLDSKACMETFVRYISNDPEVAKAALMIDSSHWETILAGLENAQGKCIVNSISLKEGEEVFLEKARKIHAMGAAMVVMAFDEQGQATTYGRKIEICRRAYGLLTEKASVPPSDIIFDVNVLSVGTGIEEHARYGIDFIEAVRWIKQNLPGAYTSGGISNLSFAFRGNNVVREAMHSVFLYHAIKAGLDMGIVNPGMLQVYDDIEPDLLEKVEDVILDRHPEATEKLIAEAQEIMQAGETSKQGGQPVAETASSLDPEERIKESLVRGRNITLQEDIMACYEKLGSAVNVIEGPLMSGMEKVGELFGAGKMFLPQVVKSAKIMKEAVDVLEPYMNGSADESSEIVRPTIINATVKGDVHDIGKNITGIVLTCNGFNVIDLGVMVDKERILDEAIRHNAAIIGVSGLITPSLFQMEEICREMTRRGLDIPLFIGGATTSALHTAVKLAPLYAHVFYCQDASTSAVKAKRIMMDRAAFEKEEHLAQAKLLELYSTRDKPEAGPVDSRAYPSDLCLKAGEYSFESVPTRQLSIDEIMPWFDWRMFLAVWGFKYGLDLPDDPVLEKTMKDGRAVIERFRTRGEVTVSYSIGMLQAWDNAGVIEAWGSSGVRHDFPMFRQEEAAKSSDGKDVRLSLCDFVPAKSDGQKGPMGIFAISVRHRADSGCPCCTYRGIGLQTPVRDYDQMMDRAVRVTLAEAASRWIDHHVAGHISRENVKVVMPAAGYASCPDHTLKQDILDMLPDGERLGISLTESYAMIPDASICGFIFMHPDATYPEIHRITKERYGEYRKLRGMSEERARQFLGHLL